MAYIQDENTIQMDWLYSNVVGGVHVQISEEGFEAAKDILQESPIADTPVDFPVCLNVFLTRQLWMNYRGGFHF